MPKTLKQISPVRMIAMILAYGVLRKMHASQNRVDLAISPNAQPSFEEINEAQRKGPMQTAHKHER